MSVETVLPNKAVETDAQVRPRTACASILVRRSPLRYMAMETVASAVASTLAGGVDVPLQAPSLPSRQSRTSRCMGSA
jgi:hypothetical protein